MIGRIACSQTTAENESRVIPSVPDVGSIGQSLGRDSNLGIGDCVFCHPGVAGSETSSKTPTS